MLIYSLSKKRGKFPLQKKGKMDNKEIVLKKKDEKYRLHVFVFMYLL